MAHINRRSLIAGASAGLVLASCRANPNGQVLTKDDLMRALNASRGGGELHGNPVHYKAPCPLALGGTFEPKYHCVQYLKFDATGLTALRGYITGPVSPQEMKAKTEAAVKDLLSGTTGDFKDINGGTERIIRDVEFIGFGSQQTIAIVLDNDSSYIKFEDRPNNDDFIVRFAPYSGTNPHNSINQTKKNNAFFNLRKGEVLVGGKPRPALYLDFWNTDVYGDTIANIYMNKEETWHRYSMNVHLLMAVTGKWVPIIFDSDTGNMGGTP